MAGATGQRCTPRWYAAHLWRGLLAAMRSGSLLGVETNWLDGALCACIAETAHFGIATLAHINSEDPSAFESAISYGIRATRTADADSDN